MGKSIFGLGRHWVSAKGPGWWCRVRETLFKRDWYDLRHQKQTEKTRSIGPIFKPITRTKRKAFKSPKGGGVSCTRLLSRRRKTIKEAPHEPRPHSPSTEKKAGLQADHITLEPSPIPGGITADIVIDERTKPQKRWG